MNKIESTINYLKIFSAELVDRIPDGDDVDEFKDNISIAIQALQEKQERENPNIIKTKIVSPISYGGYQGLCGKRYIKSKRK